VKDKAGETTMISDFDNFSAAAAALHRPLSAVR
jgi:hypothetical protein